MPKQNSINPGFTIVELMISMAVMIIAAIAIGAVIVDGQTSWNSMYDKVHSDITTDGYVVRKRFDSVIRKASNEKIFISSDKASIKLYYSSNTSTEVDSYLLFYKSGTDLNLKYGRLEPLSTIKTETICKNVSSCIFQNMGQSVQMTLVLDDGTRKNTIVTSAVAHN